MWIEKKIHSPDLFAFVWNLCTVMGYMYVIHHTCTTKAELCNSFNRNDNGLGEAEYVHHGCDYRLDADDNLRP